MATQITAYLSDDGVLHRSKDDADFADYLGAVAFSVGAFVDELGASQTLSFADVLTQWELWRIGGRDGWAALRQPMSAAPEAEQEQAPPVVAPSTPEKPKAPPMKAKPEKPRTAITEALEAARVKSERQQAEARTGPGAAAAPPAYRKHVGVVGLFNIHHSNIKKEFEDALKLTIYDADCIPRLHGLRECHKVVVMTKFISHKHVDVLKSIGQEPLLINGGMDKLKEALTNIYVNS